MIPPAYSRIHGHEVAIRFLQNVVRAGRPAPAYLLEGPPSVGKRAVAVEFARSLLCPRRGEDACPDCRKAAEGTHPHLYQLQRDPPKQNIAVEQVKEMQSALALKPMFPSPRVILIDEADTLSEEGMNALLKTLEEPPLRSIFVLIASAPETLLPTIRSRCQRVRFSALDETEVRAALAAAGFPADHALLAARLCGGRIGQALSRQEEISALKARLDDALGRLHRGDFNPLVESVTRIRNPRQARAEAEQLLDLLLLSFREMFRARVAGVAPDPVLVPEAAAGAFGSLPEEELSRRLEILLDHRRFLDLNANVGLTVENALLRL